MDVPATPNRAVYLDNQATTQCDPRVLAAMLPWFTEKFGNPHSAEHRMGNEAEAAVETARAHVAGLIGAERREIVLTSGATESNNIAIKGAAMFARDQGSRRSRIITLATEHKCVLESVAECAALGFESVILPVCPDGLADLDRLAAEIDERTLLVSVMAVNNETGVIQDLAAIGALCAAVGALFHTDAAQGFGKIPLDVSTIGAALVSISGHKIYGPKGVGALYVRRRPRTRLSPLFSGGGQERGLRSGTLATPLVVALGEAARLAGDEMAQDEARIVTLRDRLLIGLRRAIPGIVLNGHPERRIPGNLNLTFPAATAEGLMRAIPDLCVSTGSACSSAAVEPSYVLTALGLDPQAAARTLRVGLGRFTSAADIDFAVAALAASHHRAPQPA